MKLCFISYARNNNLDGRLTKFVEKLKLQLPNHLPHGITLDDLAFFDVTSIESGDQWMERLADATRFSRVCVCFYSPPYFTSEYSGREVQVFLLRLKEWEKHAANAGKPARVIVPIIWVPAKPPAVLQPFQYDDHKWPALYLREGLLALAMRNGRSDAYNAVLNELARRIAAVLASVTLPVGPPIASFGHVASAFHDGPVPNRYGIAAMVLAEPARRAKPFAATEASLDALLEQAAGACPVPLRTLAIGADPAADISAAMAAREMPLLLAHQASIDSPLNAPVLRKIAAVLDESGTVMVFSDPSPDPAQAAVALRASIDVRLGEIKAKVGAAGCLVATDAVMLQIELEKRLSKVRTDLILADPAARVENDALAASAASQGIAVASQPVLGGPGG